MVTFKSAGIWVWREIKSLKPGFASRNPHFNFITVHYFYIIGMAFLGSLCLYIRGDSQYLPNQKMPYIDALFFGSGAATQSGLNTIDVNLLSTWQQFALMAISMATNPIAINGFVIIFRIRTFLSRFKEIAKESTRNRRSLAKTFSKSRTSAGTSRDIADEERGVDGRNIVVMHETIRPNGMTEHHGEDALKDIQEGKELVEEKVNSRSSNGSGSEGTKYERTTTEDRNSRPGIKFADQIRMDESVDEDGTVIGPIHRSKEDHINFLQRQRKQDEGAALRIPGPRDADAGITPQTIDEEDPLGHAISRQTSTFGPNADRHRDPEDEENPPVRRNITIAEPSRSHHSAVSEASQEKMSMWKQPLSVFRRKPKVLTVKEVNAGSHTMNGRSNTFQSIRRALTKDKVEGMPYLSWEPTVGRNSMFVDLTEDQREELGGIEYRSLKALGYIVLGYFWGFWVFGIVCLMPWIYLDATYGSKVTKVGQGRGWWAIFTGSSAFTDLGFTLTPDSMISFNTAIWPLLLMSYLIIIGNTGFPIMLRVIIWGLSLVTPRDSSLWEEFQFLLDHPRRCFTLLFPSLATWWLFAVLVILNGTDLILFIILDLGNSAVTDLPVNIRVLDGWFQAVSTRTAGFGVIDLSRLHPGIQVSYLIMMYISVLPIAISVRRTNVYEEKSLGIYGHHAEEADEADPSYISTHLKNQVGFDLWFIALGFFIISIAEGPRLEDSLDVRFTLFSILFEIVSAYGTVGLSLGYPTINASFSAEFGVISKLVIIAMQVRGRHRGLPVDLDRAVLLPNQHLNKQEAEDAAAIVQRRRSSLGTANGNGTSTGNGLFRSATGERSMSRARTKTSVLSNLFNPGPPLPSAYRAGSSDPMGQRSFKRRHSVAVIESGRRGRQSESMSPTRLTSSRIEGRRSFFQDGVNPEPKEGKTE